MPGSDDLVARLRKAAAYISEEPEWKIRSDCREAAAEIERLSAALASRDKEIERLKEDHAREVEDLCDTANANFGFILEQRTLAATAARERDEARAECERLRKRDAVLESIMANLPDNLILAGTGDVVLRKKEGGYDAYSRSLTRLVEGLAGVLVRARARIAALEEEAGRG